MDGRHVAACTAIAALAVLAAPAGVAHAQDEDRLIPAWIRQIFVYYADEQISDAELVAALTYLIDNGIIVTDGAVVAPAAPMPTAAPTLPSTAQGVDDAYEAATDATLAATDATNAAIRAVDNALTIDIIAIDDTTSAVRSAGGPTASRAATHADASSRAAAMAAIDDVDRAANAGSVDYTTGEIDAAGADIIRLTNAAVLASRTAETYAYGDALGAEAWAEAAEAWVDVVEAQAELASGRIATLHAANAAVAASGASEAYEAVGAGSTAREFAEAAESWTAAAESWTAAAEAAERAAGSWTTATEAWDAAAVAAANLHEMRTGPAGKGAGEAAPRVADAPRTTVAPPSAAAVLTAAERAVERARIVELQDLSGPRECYTLLRSMERNLIEQDGAESQIKFMRDYLAFAPDPNDPALQQSRSLLDSSTENLRVLQSDYRTMKSTYDSYNQCR